MNFKSVKIVFLVIIFICTLAFTTGKAAADYTLDVSVIGAVYGIGSVNSDSGNIHCETASGLGCSYTYLDGKTDRLLATPAWYSLGGVWSGGSCAGSVNLPCIVTMDQARTVNATFLPNPTVKVVGAAFDYATLGSAYDSLALGSTATIQVKDSNQIVYYENFWLYSPETVTLQGGKGTDFAAAPVGFTTISGSLTISDGRLNVSNLKIMPFN